MKLTHDFGEIDTRSRLSQQTKPGSFKTNRQHTYN